jgi:hypothetical protein
MRGSVREGLHPTPVPQGMSIWVMPFEDVHLLVLCVGSWMDISLDVLSIY